MQVDQFESEVESLSVQTRKKKGDKEVSIARPLIHECNLLHFVTLWLGLEKDQYSVLHDAVLDSLCAT